MTGHLRAALLLTAFVALTLARHAAAEGCAGASPCPAPVAWNAAFNVFDVTVQGKRAGDYARWRIESSAATHDFQIGVERVESGKRSRGRVAVIGGGVLMTNGLALADGYEVDAFKEPLLYALLTAQLLGRAFPDGPAALHGSAPVRVTDTRDGLRVGTIDGSTAFGAPWSVSGTAIKDRSGAVRFDLQFVYAAPLGTTPPLIVLHLKGILERAAADPALKDDMPLAGWKLYGIGPYAARQGNRTDYDFGSGNKGYKTVADVRKALAE